jgi:hypothetical protein
MRATVLVKATDDSEKAFSLMPGPREIEIRPLYEMADLR